MAVEEGRYARVLSAQALAIQSLGPGRVSLEVLERGEGYDLRERRRLPQGAKP